MTDGFLIASCGSMTFTGTRRNSAHIKHLTFCPSKRRNYVTTKRRNDKTTKRRKCDMCCVLCAVCLCGESMFDVGGFVRVVVRVVWCVGCCCVCVLYVYVVCVVCVSGCVTVGGMVVCLEGSIIRVSRVGVKGRVCRTS